MIIGLCGKKQAGKSFTVDKLSATTKFNRVSLGDGVKEIAMKMYNLPRNVFYDQDLKEVTLDVFPYKSPREILQTLGTDICRLIHADTWLEYAENDFDEDKLNVIEDVRFVNELDFCDITFYIDSFLESDNKDTHASENTIKAEMCTYTIFNDMETDNHIKEIIRLTEQHIEEV